MALIWSVDNPNSLASEIAFRGKRTLRDQRSFLHRTVWLALELGIAAGLLAYVGWCLRTAQGLGLW